MSRCSIRAVLFGCIAFISVATLRADEGFWPFHAIPTARIAKRYDVTLDQRWLDHVRLSSVRFGGASGSFVSADGLVMTNHHVALSTLGKLSGPGRDLTANGFYAKTQAEELKAPDLELNVLVSYEDVTGRMGDVVKPGMTDAQALDARRAATSTIEKSCEQQTSLKCEVVTLYQGAQYQLYRYKRYTDVRLVFAPEYDAGFYGGDSDNFTYPRYDFDVALFRVYENDKPARVEHFLQWSPAGARDGEAVFTSGQPGSTQRLNTVAHLEFIRDGELPNLLASLERRQALLKKYGTLGTEQARQMREELFGIENSLKSNRGRYAGLKDAALMNTKRTQEATLREAVAKDPALAAKYETAWDAIASAHRDFRSYEAEYSLLASTGMLRPYSIAMQLVRLAAENAKPDAERLPEYTDARRASLERSLFSAAPIYPALEQVKLADYLSQLREKLGPDHAAVKAALAGQTPEQRAEALMAGTKIIDVAERRRIAAGGADAISSSTDTLIVFARTMDPTSRALRKRYEDTVLSVDRRAYAQVAQAIFAVRGTEAYPDATGSLRLSFGAVKGYTENGKPIPPFTRFDGLYARASEHGDQPPYRIVPNWRAKQGDLRPDTPFNLVTTNDIVGGNSGSPVINAKGQVVGLAFDGNIQSLPGYYIYDESVNRTVAVDSRAILEGLKVVYGAQRVVDEIMAGQRELAPTAAR